MAIPRLAIIGMGGFAGTHHDAVLRLEEKRLVRLVATCDPRRAAFVKEREAWRFATRRVSVFEDHEAMLEACAKEIDGVLIPTPVSLHAAMHAACVKRGLPVFLEKPATLDPVVFSKMIEVERQALKPTAVGFNAIAEPSRRVMKQRILSGEFGAMRELRLRVFWPRPSLYFNRAPWSSQLEYDGELILDSCFGNAMAHALHAALFWAGNHGVDSWVRPESVQAQLFRANPVPAPDTAFLSVHGESGVKLRLVFSHALHGESDQTGTILCEQATLSYTAGKPARIAWHDGRQEFIPFEISDPLSENLLDFVRLLRGETNRPATTLAESWSLLAVNGLAYVSTEQIRTVAPERLERVRDPREQLEYVCIQGLGTLADAFLEHGEWPGKTLAGDIPTPRTAVPPQLAELRSIITQQANL